MFMMPTLLILFTQKKTPLTNRGTLPWKNLIQIRVFLDVIVGFVAFSASGVTRLRPGAFPFFSLLWLCLLP